MKCLNFKYVPLLLFQLVLVVIFQLYLKYPLYKVKALVCGNGFAETHVMIYVGFALLMTFPKKYSFSALGYNLLLAAIASQLASIYLNYNTLLLPYTRIIYTVEVLLKADMMAAAVLITFGALLGYVSDLQLILIAFVETTLGCLNAYYMVHYLKASDIGGSIAIHTFGAYFGLGVSLSMACRNLKKDVNNEESVPLSEPNYFSNITALLGSIFLWVYWPTFNSGLARNDAQCERALINTYFALAASTVTTFFLSVSFSNEGKLSMRHVRSATLAGGVAVGSVCNMLLGAGGAITIGIVAALISVLGFEYLTPLLEKIGVLDTCGVHNVHGLPGVFSGLLTIFFAVTADKNTYAEYNLFSIFQFNKRSGAIQALNQFYALATTIGMALGGGIITGFVSQIPIFKPLKPSERYDDEQNFELPK